MFWVSSRHRHTAAARIPDGAEPNASFWLGALDLGEWLDYLYRNRPAAKFF